MNNKPLIGILAGMGPKSTGPFIDQVVNAFQSLTGAKNDIDFPHMMIYSLPTPFYVDRPIDHELMEMTICEGLKKLEACGASFIAMPCNTAHRYFQSLTREIKVPLLNMVKVTLDGIPKSAKRITLLATRATLESDVYQQGLDHAHFSYVLTPGWQRRVDEMILSIKVSLDPRAAIALWNDLAQEFQAAEIDTIVLACTDLNVVLNTTYSSFKIIDSSQSLAEAIVKKWQTIASD